MRPRPRCRGIQSGQKWVWSALFAWGVGATILNTIAFAIACCYIGREWTAPT